MALRSGPVGVVSAEEDLAQMSRLLDVNKERSPVRAVASWVTPCGTHPCACLGLKARPGQRGLSASGSGSSSLGSLTEGDEQDGDDSVRLLGLHLCARPQPRVAYPRCYALLGLFLV